MGTTLFTSKDARNLREEEDAKKAMRSQELDIAIAQKRSEIHRLDETYTKMHEAHVAQNVIEEREHQEKMTRMKKEVGELEERRRIALLPLQEREQELHDKDVVLSKREESVAIKEAEVTGTLEALTERMDEVSEREQMLDERERKLDSRKAGLDMQTEEVNQRHRALTELIVVKQAEFAKADASMASRNAVLEGREIAIAEREKRNADKDRDLHNRERALADAYRTLERAKKNKNHHA